jgi:hypothetical protein
MKNLSQDAIGWLKRMRDSTNPCNPPPAVVAAFTRSGVAKAHGRGGFTITNKGREGLRAILPQQYAPPKRFV